MPAPNEMVWYKWWPVKALTSLRWASLSVTEEGVYRRMYDLASIAQPSNRRGYFYEHNVPARVEDVLKFLRIDLRTGRRCIEKFAKMGLMEQDSAGAWGFCNFGKHQRGANLRQRDDGLGSAEIGTEPEQNRNKIGATDIDKEEDKDKEEEEEEEKHPLSPETKQATTQPPDSQDDEPEHEPDACPTPQQFTFEWNRMAHSVGLPKIQAMTDKRRAAIRQRWNSGEFWRDNWKAAIAAIPSSPFLTGKNDRGWKADVEFFLRPDTVLQIMEGKYLNTKGDKAGTQTEISIAKTEAPKTNLTDADILAQAEALVAFLDKGGNTSQWKKAKGLTAHELNLIQARIGEVRYKAKHPEASA